MSRSTPAARKRSLVESGGVLVQSLIKQPVKAAVKEALAEDRAATRARPTTETGSETRTADEQESDSRGGGALRRLFLLGVLAGIAYYAKQRRGLDIPEEFSDEVSVGESTGGRETSVDDPLSPESEGTEGSMSEDSDEGPATRS